MTMTVVDIYLNYICFCTFNQLAFTKNTTKLILSLLKIISRKLSHAKELFSLFGHNFLGAICCYVLLEFFS